MPKTIKIKLDKQEIDLADKNGNNKEKATISVKEDDLQIPDNWKYDEILSNNVTVSDHSDPSNPQNVNYKALIKRGWIYNNVVLAENSRAKQIVSTKPVIGQTGYNLRGISGITALLVAGGLGILAMFKYRKIINFFGGNTEPENDVNNPLN